MLSITAIEGLPEIAPSDDLAGLIAGALADRAKDPTDHDVLVLAHKVVSKAEGRIRHLRDVQATQRARELARALGKDPRHVQVILDETREVRRADRGVLICMTRHGFVCANAGVDASNVPGGDAVVLLPHDPDQSARKIRADLRSRLGFAPAILITDSFGRAWRRGQVDIAVGCAGLAPLEDWRGRSDTQGRELKATLIAVADELAAAADLDRTKDAAVPLVLIRGADRHVTAHDGPGIAPMIRPEAEDLFR